MADAIDKAAEAAAREFVEFVQTEEVKKIRTKEQGITNLAGIIARHMREAVDVSELHGRIMNLPDKQPHFGSMGDEVYKCGHRDARHAACDVVNAWASELKGDTNE